VPVSTFDYNRALWGHYAHAWDDPDFKRAAIDDPEVARTEDLEVLGDEWGRPADVRALVESWILPYTSPGAVVGEIGPGGGRIARQVAPHSGEFWGFEISHAMLARLRLTLAGVPGVQYVLLEEPALPADLDATFDFLYAFDVLMHFDLHLLWRYVCEIDRVLKPGGRALLHTANLDAPEGWRRFTERGAPSVESHFAITPGTVRTLLSHTGLAIIRESKPDPSNFYLARDYLCIVERGGR